MRARLKAPPREVLLSLARDERHKALPNLAQPPCFGCVCEWIIPPRPADGARR